ncbi:tetratricopeptide repeat protein [Nonomuraea longispora]|uniref:Tetratricopeptide repeat protein n=1 Tax=Nonomuraea longispora TaxID=1848320 RepID=A0A4R4MRP2_9ACTN|nr:BTAD domain-containing putative transcriptional regulator [Nonomuraea longispora]TDB96031.1 tetratricopeptide repeat protein [Nonomuraea longispora]
MRKPDIGEGLFFRVLGDVLVEADGRTLRLGRRRDRELFGVLLIECGSVVTITRLVDLLWGDDPPEYVRRSVQSHVARIRAVLNDARAAEFGVRLSSRGRGYVLEADADLIDAHRFRALVGRARQEADPASRADLLGDALELWRGPVFGDETDADLRSRLCADLEALRLTAQESRLATLIDSRQYDTALPELARLVLEHPTRERLAELHVTGLYQAGRKAESLMEYERVRQVLADLLGVHPSASLRRLHQAILRDDDLESGKDEPSAPAELPADLSDFSGRERDLETLADALPDIDGSAPSVTVITGTAGMGKTALAIRFARQVADRFPHGQIFVNLRGQSDTPMTATEALTRLLSSLGVPPEQVPTDEEAAAAMYRSRMSGRRVLVLLDNAASAEQVRLLLLTSPGCLTLITSRDMLTWLAVSHGARRLFLGQLTPGEARELLMKMVGDERASREPEAVGEMVRLCDGLPLALRVAAANVAARPKRRIADYVTALAADRLAMLEVDGDAVMRATFSISYTRLNPPERRLFRLFGLAFSPDIPVEAAAALAGTSRADAACLLDRLYATSMIGESRPGYYSMHDLLSLFAREQAEREDDEESRQAATARLLTWYLKRADRAAAIAFPTVQRLPVPLGTADDTEEFATPVEALSWLEHERAGLLAAVTHSAGHGPPQMSWLLCGALRGYFALRSHPDEVLIASQAALRAATLEADPYGQAVTHMCIADASRTRLQHEQAIVGYEAAAQWSSEADWPAGVATAHINLATTLLNRGEPLTAMEHLTAAADLASKLEDANSEAVILTNLGAIHLQLGRLRLAEIGLRRALTLHAPDNPTATAVAHHNLAGALHLLGRCDEALENAGEALRIHRHCGNRSAEVLTLGTISSIHCDADRPDQALRYAEEAWLIAEETTSPRALCEAMVVLGASHAAYGRHSKAAKWYERALRAAREANPYARAYALTGLASVYARIGRNDEARACAEQARAIAQKIGHLVLEGEAYLVLAELALDRHEYELAAVHVQRARALRIETGHRLGEDRLTAILATGSG